LIRADGSAKITPEIPLLPRCWGGPGALLSSLSLFLSNVQIFSQIENGHIRINISSYSLPTPHRLFNAPSKASAEYDAMDRVFFITPPERCVV
jgi:hypothetical protein